MPRGGVMKHLVDDNQALIILRQVKAGDSFQHAFVSRAIVESTLISNKTSEIDYVLPLFLYSIDGSKISNLNKDIVNQIERITGNVSPEDILDYIYAVLYSSNYRNEYKEYLKINFPRVPFPKDREIFLKLVSYGKELRLLHLLESVKINNFITTYPIEGTNEVEKITFVKNRVYINKDQYFGNVPEIAWNFYIGCYQPAQKWLKDRKEYTLSNSDIEHYQKIIVALNETDRLMKAIEKVKIE